jgi:ACS family hexuronate transporter-like MFS transporter
MSRINFDSKETESPALSDRKSAAFPWHWVAIGLFMLVSTINFIDRQLLAAVAPSVKSEFHLSNAQYGGIVAAFSLSYAFATPVVGALIDRVGLNIGIAISFLIWSFASIATGFTQTIRGLLACRITLGIGESSALPCAGKAGAMYLDPAELGLAGGFGSAAVTLGSVAAPLIVVGIMPLYGWRAVFVVAGALGLVWLPLWLFTSKRVPPRFKEGPHPPSSILGLLRDKRLWVISVAYALVMMVFSLWSNWTTIYLVHERHLAQLDANRRFAWIPPVLGFVGPFLSGAMTFRWIRHGQDGFTARLRACRWISPLLLATAAVPFMPSTALATGAIGLSFVACLSISAAVHVMAVDLYYAPRAGSANGVMAACYAIAQAVLSPAIGAIVDRYGFAPACILMSVLPLLGVWILRLALPHDERNLTQAMAAGGVGAN